MRLLLFILCFIFIIKACDVHDPPKYFHSEEDSMNKKNILELSSKSKKEAKKLFEALYPSKLKQNGFLLGLSFEELKQFFLFYSKDKLTIDDLVRQFGKDTPFDFVRILIKEEEKAFHDKLSLIHSTEGMESISQNYGEQLRQETEELRGKDPIAADYITMALKLEELIKKANMGELYKIGNYIMEKRFSLLCRTNGNSALYLELSKHEKNELEKLKK